MNHFDNDVTELNIDELDAVTGGAGVLDTIIQVVKKVAQVITGTTNVCTNHWYSD
jgi:bacteriocin-like protein